MKVVIPKNINGLLNKLRDPEKVKQDKSSIYFEKSHDLLNWDKPSRATEKKFSDTQICIIPITPQCNSDLFVIDCDNLYTSKFFRDKLREFEINTLTTVSKSGGCHIYFRGPLLINSIKQDDSTIVGLSKWERALQSNSLNVEFFSLATHSKKAIFDGDNNDYYSRVSDTEEPIPLPDDFRDFLLQLAGAYTNTSPKNTFTQQGKIVSYSPAKYNFVKSCLDNGVVDLPVFLDMYESSQAQYHGNFDVDYTSRNNLLISIRGFIEASGMLEYNEVIDFLILVDKALSESGKYRGKPSLYEENPTEFKNTVARKMKNPLFLSPKEIRAKMSTPSFQENVKSRGANLSNFIALNLSRKSSNGSKYLHVYYDTSGDTHHFKLNEYKSDADLLAFVSSSHRLQDIYITHDHKGHPILNEAAIIPLKLVYRGGKEMFFREDNLLNLDLDFPRHSPIVRDIINNQDHIPLISKKEFEELESIKVLNNNLLPTKELQDKFYGDIAYALAEGVGLPSVLTLWDPQGDTGKGLVFNRLINRFFFYHNLRILQDENCYKLPTLHTHYTQTSLKGFIENKFNSDIDSRVMIITEIGTSDLVEQKKLLSSFQEKIKEVTKNEFIRVENKGRDARYIKNNSLVFFQLNSLFYPLDPDIPENRIYVSPVQSVIKKEYLTKLAHKWEKDPLSLDWEVKLILKFLIHNYYEIGKTNLNNLPTPIGDDIPTVGTPEEVHDAIITLKTADQCDSDVVADMEMILNSFVSLDGEVNYGRINEALVKGSREHIMAKVILRAIQRGEGLEPNYDSIVNDAIVSGEIPQYPRASTLTTIMRNIYAPNLDIRLPAWAAHKLTLAINRRLAKKPTIDRKSYLIKL